MSHHPAFDAAAAAGIVSGLSHLDGAMLPILHALQERFGFIDDGAIPLVAEALNVSKAEVHGVISFYHDFRRSPPGRHVLKLCRAEACQAVGCEALVKHLAAEHGLAPGGTTPDGRMTLHTVYCLGNCALGPAALLDDLPMGRLTAGDLDALLAPASAGASP